MTSHVFSMYKISSNVLLALSCYHEAPAAFPYIGVDISSSQIDDNICLSLSLSRLAFLTLPFLILHLPFSVRSYLFFFPTHLALHASRSYNLFEDQSSEVGCVSRRVLVRWSFRKMTLMLSSCPCNIFITASLHFFCPYRQYLKCNWTEGGKATEPRQWVALHTAHIMMLYCRSWIEVCCDKLSAWRWLGTSKMCPKTLFQILITGILTWTEC